MPNYTPEQIAEKNRTLELLRGGAHPMDIADGQQVSFSLRNVRQFARDAGIEYPKRKGVSVGGRREGAGRKPKVKKHTYKAIKLRPVEDSALNERRAHFRAHASHLRGWGFNNGFWE